MAVALECREKFNTGAENITTYRQNQLVFVANEVAEQKHATVLLTSTVEPTNNGHIETKTFVHYSEVSLIQCFS